MILVYLFVAAAVSIFVLKGVANSIYKKTGHDGLGFIVRALIYVESFACVGSYAMAEQGEMAQSQAILIIVASVILGCVLFTLLNLKVGMPNAVILGVVCGTFGAFVALGALIMICIKLAFVSLAMVSGGKFNTKSIPNPFSLKLKAIPNAPSQGAGFETNSQPYKATYTAPDNSKTEEFNKNFDDAKARKGGFSDAQEARDAGYMK